MDYGKEKFGGPFTEEEVEDVKTVLRLLPLVICLGFIASTFAFNNGIKTIENIRLVVEAISYWLFPVLLIPLYQLLLYRCFHKCSISMLQCIGAGLIMCTFGFILATALGVVGEILSDGMPRYLSCISLSSNATNYMEWYWKPIPYILYGIGKTILGVLFLQVIIAQSPDKMKGFVMGIMASFRGLLYLTSHAFVKFEYTFCYDLSMSIILVALFVIFVILSKRYTLRERNREINIQAIAEEHYERYFDQEEEYMREHQQYVNVFDSSYSSSN